MPLKKTVNDALTRATGYQLQKVRGTAAPAAPAKARAKGRKGDRLLDRPTFILCTLRSGSTLLRVLCNSHSRLHAPHEQHLRYIDVTLTRAWAEKAQKEAGLDERKLRHLLWDRILHRELAGSGKELLVEKTPNHVFIVDELKACWPDARFIFLLRHPAAIARSRQAWKPDEFDPDDTADLIRRYCEALDRARETYEGHTVRYEELTAEPERVMRGVCAFLEVPFEPSMLEYGKHDHGRFKSALGDWSENIKSGQIQKPKPPPTLEETPEALREIAARWGYLPTSTSPAAS